MPSLAQLRSTQSAPVEARGEDGYTEAANRFRPPASPDVLVRPTTPDEVGAALVWAAAQDMEVAVRSGGHGAWAPLPGGLLLDMGAFAGVEVGSGGTVSVGPGAMWGDVADALTPHGLALSSGDTRSVGVGGNALGAGVGWLSRSVGLVVDQLVGVQLVTADGRVVEAAADDNPELFFALRGGGGNFGVATRLDFRPARLGDVVFGAAPVDAARLAEVVCGVRDAMREVPRQLGVTVLKPPPFGPAPPPPVLEMLWAGDDLDAARAAAAPLFGVGGVGDGDLRVVPYGSTLAAGPPLPPGPPPRMTSSNALFRRVPDAAAERAVAALAAHPASMFEVRFLGGAVADVPADATALAWRDAEALLHWIAFLPPDSSDAELAEAGRVWASVGRDADGLCGTFTDERDPGLVEQMYPPATLERLRTVKREWDPGNLFRRNHTIPPA
jgi:FAD/FMN-containing dehydrogenase